jgi:hypothetical protein
MYLQLIFWVFRDLFRDIIIPNNHFGHHQLSLRAILSLSTEILFLQCTEKSTILIRLESISALRIVSHGAIPIAAWMSSVHRGVGLLYGAAAVRILNERRSHTLEFRTLRP